MKQSYSLVGTLGALEAGEAVAVDADEDVFGVVVVVVVVAIAAAAAARIEVAADAAGDVTDTDEMSSAVSALFLSSVDMMMCLILCFSVGSLVSLFLYQYSKVVL